MAAPKLEPPEGRMTIAGKVSVFRYARPRRFRRRQGRYVPQKPYVIACVGVDRPGSDRPYMIQAADGRRHWPEAAAHEGHAVRVTATFVPWSNGLGARALRPRVECADEAEHVLDVLGQLGTRRYR